MTITFAALTSNATSKSINGLICALSNRAKLVHVATRALEVFKAMEIGHIFKLGTKYSDSMGAHVLTADGKSVPIVMGSYGIGVERIITAAIEQNHDADGIIWPKSITPFDVIVTITNIKDEK